MTRKISGHGGDLIVNDAVELDGQVTGKLVIEPGGSAVIRGALIGTTLSVNGGSVAEADDADGEPDGDADANLDRDRHGLEGDLGSVISDIP
jgi:hypothetical protein